MKAVALVIATLFGAATPAAFAEVERNTPYDPYYQSQLQQRDAERGYYYSRDYRRGDTARVIESRPVYESTVAKQECWNPRAGHYEEVREDGKTRVGKGAAIGAIAGGVLGHQLGSGRGNDAATVGGALLGGLLGHQVEKRHDSDDQPDLDMSRCRAVAGTSGNLLGYDVRYEYNGREYVTRMDRDPGRRLRLGDDVNADGTPFDNVAYNPAYSWR